MDRLRAALDEVVEIVKSALEGEPKTPAEILLDEHLPVEALNLLQHLLINGSQEVLKNTRSPARASFLSELATEYNKYEFEQYEFSQNLDIGAGVRKTAAEINTLLEDDDALLQARQKAGKLHQNLSSQGLRSAYPRTNGSTHAGTSLKNEAYTGMYSYGSRLNDDIGSKIVTHPPSDSEGSADEK
ncbi:hypothetical protein PI125_g1930 [Phytophthora idaei]|nr:hypothetical protein PI125_g1930 [Phytophthora idaei]KAG3171740.1 hypothetical protein PI126_g1739 [Phytophthora idaei]